jgi:putative phosphoesterase
MFLRILVISDSHKRSDLIEKALYAQPTATHVFFLGDNVRDVEAIADYHTDRIFHIVTGNCDGDTMYPVTELCTVGGVKIIYTHGHHHSVKYTTAPLLEAAKKAGAKIALYGHTHIAKTEYTDGIYIVNPGSISLSREGANSYAVIDITENGIMPIIVKT